MTLEQLTIFDFGIEDAGTDSDSITDGVSEPETYVYRSITDNVSEPKTKAVLRFLNRAVNNGKGGVGIYQPGSKKAQYFRFSYRDGKRTKHRHIPGGNIYSPVALARAKKVQGLADKEVSIDSILLLIGNFS